MNILKATKRTIASKGQLNKLRSDGFIPAILYGGKKDNVNISLKKLQLRDMIKTETFMSKVVDIEIEGSSEKVLPRDVSYDPISDEPIHIDFMRVVKGSTVILEIPVKLINMEKSPGLKKGGVLNIVRRKVELKCPAENIPNEIVLDLDNTEIGSSLKISSVKLPQNVIPTISDRDFVIATVVSPTIVIEPEKTEEATAEGETPTEGVTEGAVEGEAKTDGKEKPVDEKGTGDIVKIGMNENAVDGFRYGEDSYDIPLGMDESYVNLYMHRNWAGKEDVNGIVSESNDYYSDSREVISPDQAHVFNIQGTVTNITSDIRLSWNMDELDEAYKVTLLINGEAIDMRAETEIVVEADALHNMTVLIGDDPFAMADIPTAFGLGKAYPNPFNPMTSMRLSLDSDGYTSVKVYNLTGQVIDVIQESMMQAGYHNVVWDAADIPSGVYLVKVEQGNNVATQKVMLMK